MLKKFKDIGNNELISKIEGILKDYFIDLIEDDYIIVYRGSSTYDDENILYTKIMLPDKSDRSIVQVVNPEIYFNNKIKYSRICLKAINQIEMLCSEYNLEFEFEVGFLHVNVFKIKIIFEDGN